MGLTADKAKVKLESRPRSSWHLHGEGDVKVPVSISLSCLMTLPYLPYQSSPGLFEDTSSPHSPTPKSTQNQESTAQTRQPSPPLCATITSSYGHVAIQTTFSPTPAGASLRRTSAPV